MSHWKGPDRIYLQMDSPDRGYGLEWDVTWSADRIGPEDIAYDHHSVADGLRKQMDIMAETSAATLEMVMLVNKELAEELAAAKGSFVWKDEPEEKCPSCGVRATKVAHDTGDGWALSWICEEDRCERYFNEWYKDIGWPFGDAWLTGKDLSDMGFILV